MLYQPLTCGSSFLLPTCIPCFPTVIQYESYLCFVVSPCVRTSVSTRHYEQASFCTEVFMRNVYIIHSPGRKCELSLPPMCKCTELCVQKHAVTWKKTVNMMMAKVVVTNRYFIGSSSLFSNSASENARSPRNPPNAC